MLAQRYRMPRAAQGMTTKVDIQGTEESGFVKSTMFMDLALDEARKAAELGETPIGAVLVSPAGEVLSRAHNLVITARDPTAHAEILAIRDAARQLGSERLPGCGLYVTLEPCTMCAAAISFARLRRLYFAAWDEKGGAVENGVRFFDAATCHHRPEVYGGIGESRSAALLRDFFATRRD